MKFDIADSDEFKTIILQNRAREIHELSQQRFWGHVIVYGEPGIGKTALLEAFRDKNPVGYLGITFLRGHEVELNESLLAPFLISKLRRPNMNGFPELLIIDDFDQIMSKSIREKVATMLQEGRKWGYRVILSARKQINEKVFEQYASVIHLGGLNEKDTLMLFELFEEQLGQYAEQLPHLRQMALDLNGNPLAILDFIHLLTEVEQKKPIIYQSPVLITESDRPGIITDLRLINQRILDRIGRKPEAVRHLTPRQFEELVAELYEERGYQVRLTQQTRDGGKDLIIMNRSDIGDFMIYAECKHYAPDRPVGVSVVNELFGRLNADRATAGLVVTSSYFSPDAKVYQSKLQHQLSLIDFVKLSSMMEQL
ncbi:restriction endonuclease [Mucilaginibacter sp. BJC16-A38]|uniref:restriction endonuclease n=1 Tax=Mucilaginibacter phenanthrenivorans TaxID=1234842 RepID=UPI00215780B5|nr:restriction endonuclease [Mucilaginibacter phenanthrenivorans]MCR8559382.1 restriction endonuclease [Mucilaginibacter phenanthrenivorans]